MKRAAQIDNENFVCVCVCVYIYKCGKQAINNIKKMVIDSVVIILIEGFNLLIKDLIKVKA